MPTLTSTEILTDVLGAFKKRVPMLGSFSTNFTMEPLRLEQTSIAHIRALPTVSSYDPSTGYANGATEGRSLLVDVPITIDKHVHVPIKLSHLNNIKDRKDVYEGAIGDAGYVLGKAIVDSVLAKVTGQNISYSITEAAIDVDRDTLGKARKAMNQNGAAAEGRVIISNSDFFEELDADSRIASKDYYGQQTGGQAYGHLTNVAGFKDIYEYPDFPVNNAAGKTVTATAATDLLTAAGHGFKNGDKVRFSTTTTLPAGLSSSTTYYVIDATTDTFKVSLTDGGSAVDITDTGSGTHTVVGYENLSAFAFEPRAVALKTGLPQHTFELAEALGIPRAGRHFVVQDPETGFALMGLEWQQPGTFDLFLSVVALWGSAVGRQAGAAGTITDKAGLRIITA